MIMGPGGKLAACSCFLVGALLISGVPIISIAESRIAIKKKTTRKKDPKETGPKRTAAKKTTVEKPRLHEQEQSPLFRLPGELRNKIYRLVLVHRGWDSEIEVRR